MGSGGGAPQRNLYSETSGELQAKADLAPKMYATEAEYDPKYNALALTSLNQTLNGMPGGSHQLDYTEQVTKYRNSKTGEILDAAPTAPPGSFNRTNPNDPRNPGTWAPIQVPVSRSRTVDDPATPGLLAIGDSIAGKAADIQAKSLSTQRAADIADVGKLGGVSLAAQQAADPRTTGLIEGLTDQASGDLAAGYNLTPEQLRLAQQSVRARYQGTLSGSGPAGNLNEAIGVSQYAQDLRKQRQQFAAGTVGLRSAVYGDSFNRVLGRPAAATAQTYLGQAGGINQSSGPRMFGSTVNANDVYSSNQNAAAANNAADKAATMTYAGAGIGAGAGILAALI